MAVGKKVKSAKKGKNDSQSKKNKVRTAPRFAGEASPKLGLSGIGFLLVAVSLIVYHLANDERMLSGPFVLDARPKIVENPEIREIGVHLMDDRKGSTHSHSDLNYNDPSRPLQTLTFQLNYKYGFNPRTGKIEASGFRITNFVIHAINAILVGCFTHLLRCALMLNARIPRSGHTLVAVASAAIFAASPFNHFTATYTYARSDLMGTTGTLLFTISGLRRLLSNDYDYQRKKFCFDFKMFTALIFGLFSKQLVVITPAALLFIQLILFELPRQSMQNLENVGTFACLANVLNAVLVTLCCHLPSFLVIAAYFIFRLAKFGSVTDLEMIAPSSIEYPCYLRNQPYAWFRYGLTMIFPEGIAIDHHLVQRFFCQTATTKYCCIALFVLFVVMVGRTFNIAKAVKRQSPIELTLLTGLGWFGLNILPSSVVLTTDVYCERRAYTSAAGIYSAFSIILSEIIQRIASKVEKKTMKKNLKSKNDKTFASIVVSILAYFMMKSLKLNQNFYSEENLWRNVLKQYPDSIRGRNNLANALARISQQQIEACGVQVGSQKLVPESCPTYDPSIHLEARNLFLTQLEYDPSDGYSMSGLARYEFLLGNPHQAIEWWRKAAEADPMLAVNAYKMIGTQLHKLGQLEDAIKYYEKALDTAPGYSAELYNNLALAHVHKGDSKTAKKVYYEGINRFPNDKLLLSNKEVIESPKSRPITPDFSSDLFYQGLEHHQKGELDKAEIFYQKILDINPDFMPDVYNNMAIIYASTGRFSEGRDMWTKGYEKFPDYEEFKNNHEFIFQST